MQDDIAILRCPETKRPLLRRSDSELVADGGPAYAVRDGVACLLPAGEGGDSIRDFYQGDGWEADDEGVFSDTKVFVDTRPASLAFTQKCIARLNKHFARGGKYILDAGSGAIPHDALLDYGQAFEKRVCVDLSAQALRVAKRKLGERGLYLQGDLTNLPLQDSSMDAVTCNHVIYQIPADQQAKAFLELWRVLKPGGVAVAVYWWPRAPLTGAIVRVAKLLAGRRAHTEGADADDAARPHLYHHPHARQWFEAQDWPFRYKIEGFRVIDNWFMRTYVSDDWRGRAFLDALYRFQQMAPRLCGKYGAIPAIIIRKD